MTSPSSSLARLREVWRSSLGRKRKTFQPSGTITAQRKCSDVLLVESANHIVDRILGRSAVGESERVGIPIELLACHGLDPSERPAGGRRRRVILGQGTLLEAKGELLLPVVELEVRFNRLDQPSIRLVGRVRSVWYGEKKEGQRQ